MVRRTAISLLITFFVACIGAWPLTYLGINFFSSLAFLTVLQFVGFYFYYEYITRKAALQEQALILAREAELSKQGAEVICPCDRGFKSFVPILLNERNEYTCPGCKKDVNVLVNLKTVLVTTPVVESPDEVIKHNLPKS
ncbi:MAG: hypothetical protein EBU90_03060 [Proteobacteria bacterium]|nr:hypothetical protein [Pseudomonadota bacterium]NBP13305.1 hypothetical protein [bacterium]